MDASPMLTRLLQGLTAKKLEVVLIGNAAAANLGAPVTTLDFDFMFRDTPANRRKLKAVAALLGAVILRPYFPVSKLYRMVDDATGLQDGIAIWRSYPCSKKPGVPCRRLHPADANPPDMKTQRSSHARRATAGRSRAQTLAALEVESERQLVELIRRRLALPIEARMNFLRRRLPGGGSCL